MKKLYVENEGKLVPFDKLPCNKCKWRYSLNCPKCYWNSDGHCNVYGGMMIEEEEKNNGKK